MDDRYRGAPVNPSAAIVTLAMIFGFPALMAGLYLDVYRRVYWRILDALFSRPSIGRVLANSITAYATASDWEIKDGNRQIAENKRLNIRIACYSFTLKVWFERGGDGVLLPRRDQNALRRAIRQRVRQGRRERTLASLRRADESAAALAERFVATYDRTAA